MSQRLIFLDTETTGLQPDRHEVWEVGWIERQGESREEHHAFVVPERLDQADPYALSIGRYWDRFPQTNIGLGVLLDADQYMNRASLADLIARRFQGATIIGAVPDFDVRFLTRFLNFWGCPWTAHYHLCDVENLAVGYLCALRETERMLHGVSAGALDPPWSSDELASALGVKISEDDRHTALGDARWAEQIYDAVMGGR